MDRIQAAYGARASEYASVLGRVDQMHPCDVALISSWGAGVCGPILDAGCGPGHWTDLLHQANRDVTGIDVVPEFIASARREFPGVRYELMDMAQMPFPDGSFGGVMAWYSMIHLDREAATNLVESFYQLLGDGGSVLLGFFVGAHLESFPHAITDANYWDVDKTCDLLCAGGFRIDEVHTRRSQSHRTHGAIVATKPC
ncbi:methyltransferase [Hoyosella rhizosphaerae]|uniref:Methyltransferase n=2 Tax=Hoyosella rhizosphaerae TaxID=1755582 RepID=A0A916UJI8_9ACTN|nr:methyltransferase [Hoyosella rhizosphaerae]